MTDRNEFIKYVIDNNYMYEESQKEININLIDDESGAPDSSITYYKENGEIMLWCDENGSGMQHILNRFEINVIKYFNKINRKES